MTETPLTVRIDAPLAFVRFADRAHGNTFRREWIDALAGALDVAVAAPEVRVVVAEGLPEIFCAGATRQTLLGIADELPIDEYERFARVFLSCPLPVVAAMQGHALGGGLTLGLYADIVVLSERSFYAANFLQYGVAPYIGSTHVIPAKMGAALGAEMLLTARGYRGRELRERGCGPLVVPHSDVPARSREIAMRIAQAPRASLELVKRQLGAATRVASDEAMNRERVPHLLSRELPDVHALTLERYGHGLPA
jgi:polyketide biosynthesis enoyl-CoA hydratase PksI